MFYQHTDFDQPDVGPAQEAFDQFKLINNELATNQFY